MSIFDANAFLGSIRQARDLDTPAAPPSPPGSKALDAEAFIDSILMADQIETLAAARAAEGEDESAVLDLDLMIAEPPSDHG